MRRMILKRQSLAAISNNIVSTRSGLKAFLQKFRESSSCTDGMRHGLNRAIVGIANLGGEPTCFEECLGVAGFGNDPTKPILTLARRYFDEVPDMELESVSDDSDQPPGFWKICKAPSNRSRCTKCKQNIEAGDLRVELAGASAIVSHQAGRSITDNKCLHCFFEWLGSTRRASTKGLRNLDDLTGYASLAR